MDRRTFTKLSGLGVVGALSQNGPLNAEQVANCSAQVGLSAVPDTTAQIPARKVEWPAQTYRRLLVDTHVPDWDDLLVDFNPSEYVAMIAGAGFQSLMQYANSCVGLCLWRTKVGQVHRGMRGRDYFGEVMEECRRNGLHRVAYYSLIFDDWAYRNNPDWRILLEEGYDPQLFSRWGTVCINSPYRDHALACLRELVGGYDFEGILLDMTCWPAVCYCPHCTIRFWKEQNSEPPRLVDWTDRSWRAFQKSRERWMREFAMQVTQTIKETRSISVYHNTATAFLPWQCGVSLEQNDASDFCGGDYGGDAATLSLICKTYSGLTRTRPFVFMTSRLNSSHGNFEATKPFEHLLLESLMPTIHSAACLLIDDISPRGTLNPQIYEYLSQVNAQHDPYEPFLGGEMQADVAIFYDRDSMYDPEVKGVPAGVAGPALFAYTDPLHRGLAAPSPASMNLPHMDAVVGAVRVLREAHIPFGVVTNANLDNLKSFRAVIVPYVLEMTQQQADIFREFVRNGGVLYASGPSSLMLVNRESPRFLLEEVLGVRYVGRTGSSMTYLSPRDHGIAAAIWPQGSVGFPGSMVKASSLPGADVLATVTLPMVPPEDGDVVNLDFGQICCDPPNSAAGHDPAIVVNSFGKGKAVWAAAAIESQPAPVGADLIKHLLRKALPGPYKFEADTHPAVEVTLFDQKDKRRMLVNLLNSQEQIPAIPVGATVRILMPANTRARRVLQLPQKKEIYFRDVGPYIEFQIAPFPILSMALVEYD